jgi:hypothetical protein
MYVYSPSNLALYIRLAALDEDKNGFVELSEIKDDDKVIESIRSSSKDYLNNTSFLSALFAFSMLTIVAQTTPPSGIPTEPYAYDILDNYYQILATYIILAVFGMICELVACLICVYWYNKLCSQTPSPEDIVKFMLNHKMILPVAVLTLGIYSIIFSLSCIIFVNYGRRIGTIVSAISGFPLVLFVIFLYRSRQDTIAGLREKAKFLLETQYAHITVEKGGVVKISPRADKLDGTGGTGAVQQHQLPDKPSAGSAGQPIARAEPEPDRLQVQFVHVTARA